MRSWEVVAGQSPAVQLALATDLTLGCGRVALTERLHRDDPPTAAMLGALDVAYRSLTAALTALDPEAGGGPAPDYREREARPPDAPDG